MINKFYEELLKTQQNMMDSWKSFVAPKEEEKETEMTLADYFQQMAQLNQKMFMEAYQAPQKFFDNAQKFNPYDHNFFAAFNPDVSAWKNFMGMNNMVYNNVFKSPTEIWETMNQSFNSYNSAYNLYKSMISENGLDIKSVNRAINTWKDETNKYVKNYLIPMAPQEFRTPMNQYMDIANQAYDASQSALAPWLNENAEARDAFLRAMQEGPQAYFNYLIDAQKKMLDSLNVLQDSNVMGYSEEILALQKKAIDKAAKYNSALGNYYQKVYDVLAAAGKEAMEDLQAALKDGLEPKTFEEFYDFLNKKGQEFLEKSLKTEGFNKLVDETLKAVSEFKEESNELGKEYFAYLQVPVRADITRLEDTVAQLNAKIDALNEELKNLKK